MSTILRFPSPFEVETPAGCEGWEAMYPAYMRFSQARRDSEESRLWFYNGMHFPEPISPFDVITAEAFYVAIGEMNARFFCIPPALGVDFRVLNGYVYISGIPVTDPRRFRNASNSSSAELVTTTRTGRPSTRTGNSASSAKFRPWKRSHSPNFPRSSRRNSSSLIAASVPR